ncbi:hypothetical protein ABAC460_15375 [Asticcacaulis sp. AC460]|uniref:hypothetical protein n=1 Tax=Asticcacaulis sp. AC460 TaxID=1282360 RepID=UPI0003C3EDCA|nr:hypothetical protein [Asticcacaulis sp. AC460]ESQ88578.1 hypothetical protein ABAC460_15375 [Asticcacaulis sp. AC460]
MQKVSRRHAILSATAITMACTLAWGTSAQAQTSIRIGKIASQETCTYYQNSEGSAAAAASADWFGASAAVAVAWRTWWVKDCVSNFKTMTSSLEAALAASNKLTVVDRSGDYVLSGTVSADGTRQTQFSQDTSRGADYDLSANKLYASMNVTLQDRSGRKVFGATVRKEVDLSAYLTSDGTTASVEQSGQAVYNQLQEALALAVARKIAFRLEPLTVIDNDDGTIQLNYGAPYLQLGTTVQATSPDGRTVIRYNVIAANDATATAEPDGAGDTGRITPGSSAIVIEADDPAANGRRMKRVDLP